MAFRSRLWGTMKDGERAGERIKVSLGAWLVVDCRIFIDDELILLTRTEFDILEALSARPGIVLSRRQLLEIIRDEPWVGNEHLVDVHIGHLRRKLGDDAARPRYIATVRGVGYRMGTGQ